MDMIKSIQLAIRMRRKSSENFPFNKEFQVVLNVSDVLSFFSNNTNMTDDY